MWEVRSKRETACSDVGTFDNKLVFICKVDDKVVSGERAHEYRVIAYFWALCVGQPTANTCVYECSTNYIYFAPLALHQRANAACGWWCRCEPAYRTQNNYHHKVLADEKTFLFYDGRQPPKEKNWARYKYRCFSCRRRHRKSARDESLRGRRKKKKRKKSKEMDMNAAAREKFFGGNESHINSQALSFTWMRHILCVSVFAVTDCHFWEVCVLYQYLLHTHTVNQHTQNVV